MLELNTFSVKVRYIIFHWELSFDTLNPDPRVATMSHRLAQIFMKKKKMFVLPHPIIACLVTKPPRTKTVHIWATNYIF